MTPFVEAAVARAGLSSVIPARSRGDVEAVRALLGSLGETDLLILGAVADAVRVAEVGEVVRVHPSEANGVSWITDAENELALLRKVALARITGGIGCRIGVDWGRHGLELAQVALGFGATDLTGPITRKSGVLISEDELKKVKGQGMVARSALKLREISALIRNAGRVAEVTDETLVHGSRGPAEGGHASGPPTGGTRDESPVAAEGTTRDAAESSRDAGAIHA